MTCEGQIMSSLKSGNNETTPLQDKLEIIATDIGKLGMMAALLIFHCLLAIQFIEGMARRRFDLRGGPQQLYAYTKENPKGQFGTDKNAPKNAQ